MSVKLMIHMKRRLIFFCARKRDFEADPLQLDLTSCKMPPKVTIKTGPVMRKSYVYSF
jgi:hypothetical protein